MPESSPSLRILLHAPTAAAVTRARNNLANLMKSAEAVEARIVLNADAVRAALDEPNEAADPLTLVCPNTLQRIGRCAPASMTVLDEAAILAIARMQAAGWLYVRA